MIDEQVGQFGRGEADETDRAPRARMIGPRRLAAVVDERREDEGDVARRQVAARPGHVVPGARQDGRGVPMWTLGMLR